MSAQPKHEYTKQLANLFYEPECCLELAFCVYDVLKAWPVFDSNLIILFAFYQF